MKMKRMLIIVGGIVLIIIMVAITAFGFYWHRNLHWYDKYEKALSDDEVCFIKTR